MNRPRAFRAPNLALPTPVAAIAGRASIDRIDCRALPLEQAGEAFRLRWRDFLGRASHGHLQQSFEFASLKQDSGWNATFVWVEENGAIRAGATILDRRIPSSGRRIAMIPCGPCWIEGHEGTLRKLFQGVDELCRERKVIFCRLNTHCPESLFEDLRPQLPPHSRELKHVWSYWNLARDVMRMDIGGSRDEVFRRMHRDTRMKCRRAAKRGIQVRTGELGDLPGFVGLMGRMRDRKKVLIRNEDYFRRLLELFPADRARLFIAEQDSKLVGGSVAVYLGDIAWYLYGAIDYDMRNLYPSEALQMAMIDWAREQRCRWYDLGGSCTDWPPREDEKGYGVFKFKERLGARAVIMAPYCDLVYRPSLYKLSRLAESVGIPLVLEEGAQKFRVILKKIRESV